MEFRSKVQVIVPTYNRPELLFDLMESIGAQSVPIECVTLIDSSDENHRLTFADVDKYQKLLFPIQFKYETCAVMSAPYQRNRGLDLVCWEECDFVLFLDDDTRPEERYAEKIIHLLTNDDYSVGGSGVTGPPPAQMHGFRKWIRKVFFLYSTVGGKITASGFNFPLNEHDQGPQVAEWIFGCSLWKSKVFENVRFPETLPGGALYDDVIFSVRARKFGNLLVDPSAKLTHLLSSSNRPNSKLDAIRKVRNRFEVVKLLKPKILVVTIFWWSNFGVLFLLTRHAFPSLLGKGNADNQRYADALKGHLIGSLMVLTRKDPV